MINIKEENKYSQVRKGWLKSKILIIIKNSFIMILIIILYNYLI